MIVYVKKQTEAAPLHSTLLNQPWAPVEGLPGVFECGNWNAPDQPLSLTEKELGALKRKYTQHAPNYVRAERVKALMLERKTQVEIIRALRPLGWGYGERLIKADHAALSEVWGRKTRK